MLDNTYILEIYLPDSADDVLITFESNLPFQNIQRGDLLNDKLWNLSYQDPKKILKVTSTEHIIWKTTDKVKQKVCIFTTEVEDTRDERFI